MKKDVQNTGFKEDSRKHDKISKIVVIAYIDPSKERLESANVQGCQIVLGTKYQSG
jgi:hypothetical protein